MKKTVLTYGLISGAIAAGMMVAGIPLMTAHDYRKAEILGYTSIVLAMLLVFFGVRSYRENVADGRITFGRAFGVGILITLVSCLCYVVTWEAMYFGFVPGLGEKVAECMVERVKASGASQEKIDETAKQAEQFKKLYDNPAVNVALTFVEPFPIGLLATAISAAILRRKGTSSATGSAPQV